MPGPDVFISYAHDDAATARLFADAFAAEGLDVWWDDALRSGEVFDEAIEAALRAAKVVVVLWSPRSVSSRWVRAEATLADRNKTLVPAMIAPCERPIIFELTHTAELSHWSGEATDSAWRAFLSDVRGTVERGRAAEAKTMSPGSPPARPVEAGRPSLAIMPFTNRSGEASDDVFADGMVEDLIAALCTGAIRVISRSASRAYRGTAYDIRLVGEALGAKYLLEGNVRRVGETIRVTAQLVDSEQGAILWTRRFDRPLADLAALQEELVVEVAGQLGVQLQRIEIERALRKPNDVTAWEHMMRALGASLEQSPQGIDRGLGEARKAVELAPDYAPAQMQLAQAASINFWQGAGARNENLRKEARDAVRRALRLDPENPALLAGAAQTCCTLGAWREGLNFAQQAYQRAPENEHAHAAMIMASIYFKRTDEALHHLDAFDRLVPPGGPMSHVRLIQRCGCHFMRGEYEVALALAERSLMFQPTFQFAFWQMIILQEKLGRREEAFETLRELKDLYPAMTLDHVERLHKGSLLAPDVAEELYATFATVWRDYEERSAQPG